MNMRSMAVRALGATILTSGFVALAAGVPAGTVAAGAAAPASCSAHWLKAVSGSWATAKDWSGDAVPTGGRVCITVNGTYTVSLTTGESLTNLTVGGTSGTQTLRVDGSGGSSTELYAASGSTTAHGVILLQSTKIQGGSYLSGNTFTNEGQINTDTSGGGIRFIETNIINRGGSLHLDASKTAWDDGNTFTNLSGSLDVGTGASVVFGGSQFNQDGGTIGGAGPAPVIDDGTLNFTGSGAGSFTMEDGGTLKGSTVAGQTVTIEGGPNSECEVGLAANFTNGGTLVLTSNDPSYWSDLNGNGFQLFNTGTLTVAPGSGGARYLEADTVNTGTMNIDADVAYDDGNNLTNNAGTIDIAAGANLVEEGGTVTQASGTVTGAGNLDLDEGTLDLAAGGGAGTFDTYGVVSLEGTCAADQTVAVNASDATGNAELALQADFTNNGTITFDTLDPDVYTDLAGSFTFDNAGTVTTEAGAGGIAYFESDTTNTGTFDLEAASNQFDEANPLTSSGTIELAAGANLQMGGGPLTLQAGGTLRLPVTGTTSATVTNVGALTVGGTLAIPTTGSPAVGTEYHLVTSTSRSGSWAGFHFTGASYTVAGKPTGVYATVKA